MSSLIEVTKIELTVSDLESQVLHLARAREGAEGRLERARKEIEGESARRAREIKTLGAQLARAEELLRKSEEERQALKARFLSIGEKVEAMAEHSESKTEQVASRLQDKIKNLKLRMAEDQVRYKANYTRVKRRLAEAEAARDQATVALEKLKNTTEPLQSQVARLRVSVEEERVNRDALERKIAKREEAHRAEVQTLDRKMSESLRRAEAAAAQRVESEVRSVRKRYEEIVIDLERKLANTARIAGRGGISAGHHSQQQPQQQQHESGSSRGFEGIVVKLLESKLADVLQGGNGGGGSSAARAPDQASAVARVEMEARLLELQRDLMTRSQHEEVTTGKRK